MSAPADPSADPLFARGLEEFRAGRFFEAHEEWERLWMQAEGDARLFLQALIQVAAACVHLTRGNAGPGIRLLSLAAGKLERFGDEYSGIHTDSLRKGLRQAAERAGCGDPPGSVAGAIRL